VWVVAVVVGRCVFEGIVVKLLKAGGGARGHVSPTQRRESRHSAAPDRVEGPNYFRPRFVGPKLATGGGWAGAGGGRLTDGRDGRRHCHRQKPLSSATRAARTTDAKHTHMALPVLPLPLVVLAHFSHELAGHGAAAFADHLRRRLLPSRQTQ